METNDKGTAILNRRAPFFVPMSLIYFVFKENTL